MMIGVLTYALVLRRLDDWAEDYKLRLKMMFSSAITLEAREYCQGMLTALSATRLYLRKFSAEAGLTVFESEGENDELR